MRKITGVQRQQPAWSEEELRWIVPEPAVPGKGRRFSTELRDDVSTRNLMRAGRHAHELTRGSRPTVIYAPAEGQHGNFIEASYRRILARPEWSARLAKVHTARRQAQAVGANEEKRVWRELDTASSSDALLMNIFCYPRVVMRPALTSLLGVEKGVSPIFGVRCETGVNGTLKDRTEIDMRLGSLLVEAKLTEADFQCTPMRLMERYTAFEEVFERASLRVVAGAAQSYQLLRGVLAAHQTGCSFAVMADARRPDLREDWLSVLGAVRGCELRTRLRFYTWQEIAGTLPCALQTFLGLKYGIIPWEKAASDCV